MSDKNDCLEQKIAKEIGDMSDEEVADNVERYFTRNSQILAMLQSLGFDDCEPPKPFPSMKDIAKRRFTGEKETE